jgi:hypothetical protein
MKQSPHGPFGGIGWFCIDGAVLGPRAGCSAHGGGIQHGTWSDRTRELRADNYKIANILADLEPAQFTGPDADLALLRQIVLERFLMGWDQGWIFRGAFTYRGAFQIEDEEVGARRVVRALLSDPLWREPSRFALLRETVRLFPIHVGERRAGRADALSCRRRRCFMPLRADPQCAGRRGRRSRARVRARARAHGGLRGARRFDRPLYAPDGAPSSVETRTDHRRARCRRSARRASSGRRPGAIAAAARLLRLLRETFPK